MSIEAPLSGANGITSHLELHESKLNFVKQVWIGAGVLSLLDAPAIIWRGIDIGWHLQLVIHMCLCLTTIGVAYFRNHIGFSTLSIGLISFSTTLGLAGIFSLGMTGTGFFWIAFSTFLVCLLYSRRAGVIMALLAALSTILAACCFVNGELKPPFDLSMHVVSASAWFNFLIVTSTVPFITLFAVSKFQRTITDLLSQISRQRDLLVAQRDQLNIQQHELEKLAHFDALTGLPSLIFTEGRLKEVTLKVNSEKIAIMFIDLDGFKAVNDTYGHHMGDLVLKDVAKRLRHAIRSTDLVTRVGGDEFMVIIYNAIDRAMIEALAGKIIASIQLPMKINGVTINIGASVGISTYPDQSENISELKTFADQAMYKAKRSGKNNFKFFELTNEGTGAIDAKI